MTKTLFVLPWLVALLAGYQCMPALNIFKVDARGAGTLAVDPWRIRSMSALRSAGQTIRAWLRSLVTPRLAFACLAVLLALLAMRLSGIGDTPSHIVVAIVPVAAAGASSAPELRTQRATLVREAGELQDANGNFKDDAARAAFDAKMTQVEDIDQRLRALEATSPAPAVPPAAVPSEARQAIMLEERQRGESIREAVRTAKLDPAFADELVRAGLTLTDAKSRIFEKLVTLQGQTPTRSQFTIGEDARDKTLRGAANWLLVRSGVAAMVAKHEKAEERSYDPGEFRGLSLVELARLMLERGGRQVTGWDKMRLVSEAFTYRSAITQSTSDFATLLENVMNKVLLAAYAITPDTWRRFCTTGTVNDFRASNRYRMGSFGALDALLENGEFKRKTISDAEKATIQAATKGNIINVSRQMIINDDMSGFSRLPQMLGRAAALSIEVDVYALLALNAGLGPTMNDGLAMFDAGHNNISTPAALSAANIDADRVTMAQQKDKDGNDFIDLRPAVLLVPVGLGGQARVINQSQYDPDTIANKSQMKPNIVVGLFRDIVDTPRLTGTRRYLFADPDIAPTIEVAFLEGQSAPVLETRDGWDVDGAEMKARFDYGVAGIDFRSAVTNAGA